MLPVMNERNSAWLSTMHKGRTLRMLSSRCSVTTRKCSRRTERTFSAIYGKCSFPPTRTAEPRCFAWKNVRGWFNMELLDVVIASAILILLYVYFGEPS